MFGFFIAILFGASYWQRWMLLIWRNWLCLWLLWSNLISSNGLPFDFIDFSVHILFVKSLKNGIIFVSSFLIPVLPHLGHFIMLVKTSRTMLNNWNDSTYSSSPSLKRYKLKFYNMNDVWSSSADYYYYHYFLSS